ncbi:MAG: HAMP domain-containing histidine kinase [Acidobacteria bacterium]|nr:HAMP domain-containing histidine kinase [Acidobacteriota bacterium]
MIGKATSIIDGIKVIVLTADGEAAEVSRDGVRTACAISPSLADLFATGAVSSPARIRWADGNEEDVVIRPLPGTSGTALVLATATVTGLIAGVVENLINQIAHDARNHVFSLHLQAEMGQRRSGANPEIRSHFDAMLRQADGLTAYLDKLLLFGRPVTLNPRPTDPVAFVREVVQRFSFTWDQPAEPVSIRVDNDGEECVLAVDQRAIGVALTNILDNAARSATPPPDIAVQVTASPELVTITVADKGPGIPADQQSKLFMPMLLRRGGSSPGLGLAITRKMVEAHHGRVGLSSSAAGTRVQISLPRNGDA